MQHHRVRRSGALPMHRLQRSGRPSIEHSPSRFPQCMRRPDSWMDQRGAAYSVLRACIRRCLCTRRCSDCRLPYTPCCPYTLWRSGSPHCSRLRNAGGGSCLLAFPHGRSCIVHPRGILRTPRSPWHHQRGSDRRIWSRHRRAYNILSVGSLLWCAHSKSHRVHRKGHIVCIPPIRSKNGLPCRHHYRWCIFRWGMGPWGRSFFLRQKLRSLSCPSAELQRSPCNLRSSWRRRYCLGRGSVLRWRRLASTCKRASGLLWPWARGLRLRLLLGSQQEPPASWQRSSWPVCWVAGRPLELRWLEPCGDRRGALCSLVGGDKAKS